MKNIILPIMDERRTVDIMILERNHIERIDNLCYVHLTNGRVFKTSKTYLEKHLKEVRQCKY
jgi:hypothetical protein